tara:strand:+ start:77 stop:454 length:378 start_codon:yes stop_codon:yes gene_type:complete
MQGASEEKTHADHAQAMQESEFVNPWTNTANLVPHGAAVEQHQEYINSHEQKHSEDGATVYTMPMPQPPQVYPLAEWPGFVLEEQMEEGDDPVWTNLATGVSHFGQGPFQASMIFVPGQGWGLSL